MISGKRVLVTGGAGSIGSEICRQLAAENKVFIFDQNESDTFLLREELRGKGHWVHSRTGDVRNEHAAFDVFSDFKPQLVFHCAALKHVSPNEEYPEEAVQTNVIGTLNLVKEAKRWECLEKFVFISTDKAISPNSIMGATKKLGEIITKNQGKRFIAVRFANVLGSRGSVIPIWQGQIDRGEAVTVTDRRAERYFMTIEEACRLVIEAAEVGVGGEIFVLDAGRRVNVFELAKKIVLDSRSDVPVELVGLRPGEQLTEELMLEEEKIRAEKRDDFWIIR